jgi:uncharacterized protein (DUF1330 family)
MSDDVTLCVLLWAHDGQDDALVAYEDAVLALVPEHGGRMLQRVRSDGRERNPLEVHMLSFPSDAALDAYLADERRVALADLRERAIARSEVLRVDVIE